MSNRMQPTPLLHITAGGRGGSGAGTIQLSSPATSVNAALPTDSTGATAKYVYVSPAGHGYFRLSVGASAAVVTDLLLTQGQGVLLVVGGNTFANWISNVGTIVCNVSAVEM